MKISLIFVLVFLHSCRSNDEKYNEELYIRPLATGETYFNLLFTTIASPDLSQGKSSSSPKSSRFSVQNYNLFPKLIADVVRSNGVDEFHVSLTQGLWRYDRWGMPIVGSPPGAEVWAWFHPEHDETVSKRWTSFVHQLGGLFCASFNFIDSNVSSTSPHFSFRPQSTLPKRNSSFQDESFLRYAVLPREIVCTGVTQQQRSKKLDSNRKPFLYFSFRKFNTVEKIFTLFSSRFESSRFTRFIGQCTKIVSFVLSFTSNGFSTSLFG